jgi:lipopolysaccharide biosynthesis glycosyltransferase
MISLKIKKNNLKIYILIFLILFIFKINYKLINKKIAVAYSLNNKYTYQTLVSMISILENSSRYTFYTFYLLVEKNIFEKQNKEKFTHLEKKYDRCKVIILELTNENLLNARVDRYPITAYYRLLLAKLIPHVNRIIYLDGDTLVFTDLTEMINLDMNNNIILGFVDQSYKKAEKFGFKTYKYINSGVLLIDLQKIRKENISQKFFDFIDNNKNKLKQEDQTVINIVLHGRIGLLPPKFGIWNFLKREKVLRYNHYKNKKLGIKAYSDEEILKGWRHPSILHFVSRKPWKKHKFKVRKFFYDKWWDYAKKSGEFENILKFTQSNK